MIFSANDEQTEFSGILYNSADDEMNVKKDKSISIDLSQFISNMKKPVGQITFLDQNDGNPFKLWTEMGSKRFLFQYFCSGIANSIFNIIYMEKPYSFKNYKKYALLFMKK
jgi:hypothetical protein